MFLIFSETLYSKRFQQHAICTFLIFCIKNKGQNREKVGLNKINFSSVIHLSNEEKKLISINSFRYLKTYQVTIGTLPRLVTVNQKGADPNDQLLYLF